MRDQLALVAEQSQTYVLLMACLARKEEELFKLVNQLEKASTTYAMEISAEKNKMMNNNTREISSDIRIGCQNLETVQSFKCLGQMLPNVLYYFGKGHSHTFSSMDSRTSTTTSLKDKTFIWSEPIADKKRANAWHLLFKLKKHTARCTSLKYGWIIAVYHDSVC